MQIVSQSMLFDHMAVPDLVDHPGFFLKCYPNSDLVEYIIKENTLLDEQMAHDSKQLLEAARPGKKIFLLVSSEGLFKVTKKARRLAAGKAFSDHLAAVSCYTGNTSLFLLGELYNKINKPAVPTRVFYSREGAMEWLLEQIAEGDASGGVAAAGA